METLFQLHNAPIWVLAVWSFIASSVEVAAIDVFLRNRASDRKPVVDFLTSGLVGWPLAFTWALLGILNYRALTEFSVF